MLDHYAKAVIYMEMFENLDGLKKVLINVLNAQTKRKIFLF